MLSTRQRPSRHMVYKSHNGLATQYLVDDGISWDCQPSAPA